MNALRLQACSVRSASTALGMPLLQLLDSTRSSVWRSRLRLSGLITMPS